MRVMNRVVNASTLTQPYVFSNHGLKTLIVDAWCFFCTVNPPASSVCEISQTTISRSEEQGLRPLASAFPLPGTAVQARGVAGDAT